MGTIVPRKRKSGSTAYLERRHRPDASALIEDGHGAALARSRGEKTRPVPRLTSVPKMPMKSPMTKYQGECSMMFWHRLAFAGLFVAASVVSMTAGAQQPAPLQAGEILENGGGQQVKVLQCRPVSYGRECQTVAWENGRAASNPAWWDEDMLRKGDARVRESLGKPPRGGVKTDAQANLPTPLGQVPKVHAGDLPKAAADGAPAAGGRVPDGAYKCQMWMGSSYVNLGMVRSAGGVLNPDPLAKVGATITGVTPSADGMTISYTTARGYRESMDCTRE
ncbi:hypothetical protein [Azospirillum doebereinerae]|uniref:Uncharacterized protein n=1 Tax=Azospirillum doebereinerae TaxID=92933 RepID=A0A3S0WV24_9PROT|nr:hypothetical protein [Azospirillum doebereinerae]RUQ62048.1 hypothetical protein EJ913_28965 [Azospirillum doebereinerae]